MTADQQRDVATAELGLLGIVDLATGYQRAQVLFVANTLGIFGILAKGPKAATEVAATLGSETRGVEALLDACVALGLLHRSRRGYENSRTAQLFLLPDRETSFSPVLRFWQRFGYAAWGRLADAVCQNRPHTAAGPKDRDLFDELLEDEEQARLFFDGLAGLAYWPARKVAALVDFSRRRHLLDLGGGSGTFSEVIARRHPHLRITLFDRAPVCTLARERLARTELNGRLDTVAGDFFRDPLPTECDCVLLSHVLHDWSPDECQRLLRKVRDALPEGGEVIIHDFLPPDKAVSPEASLFALALVLDTRRGQVYTRHEIEGWLEQCGFRPCRHEAVTPGTSLLIALKEV